MGRYLLFFSYLGNRYRGLQKQVKNCNVLDVDCVQGAIESAFQSLKPRITGPPIFTSSSRTDTGVHALCNAAHVIIENNYGLLYHPESLTRFLNRHLLRCRHEIRIQKCVPITDQFHARFSAKSRTYFYRFLVPKTVKDTNHPIFELNRSTIVRFPEFDINKVIEGTKLFIGLKDFTTFASVNKTKRDILYRRSLYEFYLEKALPLFPLDPLSERFDHWQFKCKGRSFLHNQVRRMVGTLFALGAGRVTEKEIKCMLQVPSHNNWNPRIVPAPPSALILANVEYDPEELRENTILYNEKEFLEPMNFDELN